MTGYDNFIIRTTLHGSNMREAKINNAKHILDLSFADDPSYCNSMFRWMAGKSSHKGEHVDIRLFARKYSSANGYTTSFQVKTDEIIDVGDYFFDDSLNEFWICTELHHVNDIHISGKLTLCNWVLKWQDKDGEIIEYPCQDINSTQYNSGESGDKTMTLGSAQHMATVQATAETIGIRSPMRFFVSRDYSIPFRVTQNDTVAHNYGNGLCRITLTQDQLKDTDNQLLGICDYIDPDRLHTDDCLFTDTIANICGEPFIKNGFSRTYKMSFYDKDNHLLEDVVGKWNVISDFDINQQIEGNLITLSINDDALIGKTFQLQVVLEGIIEAEMTVMVVEAF